MNRKPTKKDIKEVACNRCGYTYDLERHHIKHRKDGGTDEISNLWWLCRACHDYQHAKDAVLAAIKGEYVRIAVLKKRLAIIEEANTTDKILERGYQPYFELFAKKLPPKTKCGRQNY